MFEDDLEELEESIVDDPPLIDVDVSGDDDDLGADRAPRQTIPSSENPEETDDGLNY